MSEHPIIIKLPSTSVVQNPNWCNASLGHDKHYSHFITIGSWACISENMQLGCSLATAVRTRDCKFSNVSRASAQLFHLALTCGGRGVSPSNISVQSSVNSIYAVIVTRLRRQGGSEILANACKTGFCVDWQEALVGVYGKKLHTGSWGILELVPFSIPLKSQTMRRMGWSWFLSSEIFLEHAASTDGANPCNRT